MLNLSILISTAFSMLVRAAPVFRAWATVKLASRALWPWPPLEVILAISASIFFFFSRAFFSLWVSATFLTLTSSSTSLSALPLSSLLSSSEDLFSFFDAFILLFSLPFLTNFSSSTSHSSSFISFSAIFLALSFLLELFFDFATGAGGSGGSSSEELLASTGVKDFPFLAGLTSSSESAATIKFFIFSSIPLSSPQSSSCFFPFFPFLGGMIVEFSLVEVNQASI